VLETDRDDVLATYAALVDGTAPLKPAYLSILHKDRPMIWSRNCAAASPDRCC